MRVWAVVVIVAASFGMASSLAGGVCWAAVGIVCLLAFISAGDTSSQDQQDPKAGSTELDAPASAVPAMTATRDSLAVVETVAALEAARSLRAPEIAFNTVDGTSVRVQCDEQGSMDLEIDGEPIQWASQSPNGRFVVGASPFTSGSRSRWLGCVALLDLHNSKICIRVPVRDCYYSYASDQGRMIVNATKGTGALGGSIRAYEVDGTPLWAKHFRVNISDSGISADGSRAFVSTCNGPCEAQSGQLYLLDGASGEVLERRSDEASYKFRGNELVPLGRD